MKNTLWIFGDSFSCGGGSAGNGNGKLRTHLLDDGHNATPTHTWPMLVKDSLGYEKLYNWGNGGSAISYSQWQWNARKQHFVSGDIAIIMLTQPERAWFCFNKPYLTHIQDAFDEFGIDKKLQPQVAELLANLMGYDIVRMQVHAWICQIQAESVAKGIRTIVIPCFHESELLVNDFLNDTVIPHDGSSLMFFKGNLMHVGSQEIGKDLINLGVSFMKEDWRMGHLCPANHVLLADTITDCVLNWNPADLNSIQWFTDIFTVKNILDDDYALYAMTVHDIVKEHRQSSPESQQALFNKMSAHGVKFSAEPDDLAIWKYAEDMGVIPKTYWEKLDLVRNGIKQALSKK